VAEGTPAELKQRVAEQRLDLTVATGEAFAELHRRLGTRVGQADATRHLISVPTDGSAREIRALLDDIDPRGELVDHFAVHAATLDDVFLALTGAPTTKEPAHV
jgi:ABC-2 type transport system ATP-binding protein